VVAEAAGPAASTGRRRSAGWAPERPGMGGGQPGPRARGLRRVRAVWPEWTEPL